MTGCDPNTSDLWPTVGHNPTCNLSYEASQGTRHCQGSAVSRRIRLARLVVSALRTRASGQKGIDLAQGLIVAWLIVLAAAAPAETIAGMPRVIDGDSLVFGKTPVRLHGIDAPEQKQPYGKEAKEELARLIVGSQVTCEQTDTDRKYGRIVAVCRVGAINLNEAMMRSGLAWAFVEYSSDYLPLEQQARAVGVGIWQRSAGVGLYAAPSPQAPWEFRAARRSTFAWRTVIGTSVVTALLMVVALYLRRHWRPIAHPS